MELLFFLSGECGFNGADDRKLTSGMTGERILERLLAGRWRDPETGSRLVLPISRIMIAPSLAGQEAHLLAPLALGERLAVVSDQNTYEALGRRVERALKTRTAVQSLVLEDPHADLATARAVMEQTHGADALVAVGSGTLNDLCKYASFATGRPCVVFGTAPSMNGYVTGTASLTVEGLKATRAAHPPRAVLLDLEVLRNAPPRLIRAGLGDVLCRTTAQADWLLGHLLLGIPYDERPYHLQAEDEAPLLNVVGSLARRDPGAIGLLTRMIVLSGVGMVLAGSSQPASMGEHLISHYLDTMAGKQHPQSLHGEQVGVATLTMSRLQNMVVACDRPPLLRPTQIDERALLEHFGPRIGPACIAAMRQKALDASRADELNALLAERWAEIRARLRAVVLPTSRLESALRAAGAPITGAALGFEPSFYRQALRRAREIRERYSFLDLAADADLLEKFVEAEA